MKRRDLIRHLEQYGCVFVREGGNHTIYQHVVTQRGTMIPRHQDIKVYLARKICRDLGVPIPLGR